MLITACVVLLGSAAFGGTVGLTNGTQSGQADFTFGNGYVDITLTNLTTTTRNAVDLLTGFGFDLGSITGASLTKAVADTIYVDSNGDVTADGTGVDLLAITNGKKTWASWSLVNPSGDYYELHFNPTAQHAIIGPTETDGTYSKANSSVAGNPGKNPFSDQSATFRVSATGITASSELTKARFLFGTDFGTVVVPLPSGAWAGLALLFGIGAIRRHRRRTRRI